MFQLFKKKTYALIAPIDGVVISLEDIPDPVFSGKLMGDGVAIQATGDIVYAPADGVITVTIETKHAFGMSLDNGMVLIVHVGLDCACSLHEGFTMLVKEHQRVSAGTPIIKIDRTVFKDKNLLTPIVVTNPEVFKFTNMHIGETVIAKESILIEYH